MSTSCYGSMKNGEPKTFRTKVNRLPKIAFILDTFPDGSR